MKKRVIGMLLCAVLASSYIISHPLSTEVLSRYGSSGEEVVKIQERLKNWGYYDGNIDGVYGVKTAEAIKKFQEKNGLKADGIAGEKTLASLGLANTVATSGNGGNSTQEGNVDLLARAINGEARGEPYTGQVAVGAVIMNRVRHASFPNTIAGVIYQPGAFTAVSDGQIHANMSESCIRAARDALNGWDPVGGAIYYYNPKTATNQWIRTREVIATIGKHVFCN